MKRVLNIGLILLLAVLLVLPAGPFAAADTVRIGDVDGDGEITAQDANCITRHLAGYATLDAAARSRADFDGDGLVTSMDASLILSALFYTEEQAPAQWDLSMIVTADLSGTAWGADTLDARAACSALNIATFVQREREADPNILLLDAGGSIYGSAIADEYEVYTEKTKGPMTAVFSRLNYDAVLLGDEAITFPSYRVRNEMDNLKSAGVKVVGTNLMKAHPSLGDAPNTPWNEILQYTVIERPKEDGTSLRIGVIGLVDPTLADPTDEVAAFDPLTCYEMIRKKLANSCDCVVLLYHGRTEADDAQDNPFSLRGFLRATTGIDLVLAAHGNGVGSREEQNAEGREVPIIQLNGGVNTVTKLVVQKRANGRLVYRTDRVDMRGYEADETLKKVVKPYVSALSLMMDAPVCTLEQDIEPHAADALSSTDGMDLIHEMQIWAATAFMEENGIDLPTYVLSIAYPYYGTRGLKAGQLRYGDLCALNGEVPRYTLLLVRGGELRAWLRAYAKTISEQKKVYSLYGLSYLINTWNADAPLGFLEYSSDYEVEEDDVFTVILAEEPEGDNILAPYLDESWMSYEDRVVASFRMPETKLTDVYERYAAVTPLVAFLETRDTFSLKHAYRWMVI